MPEMDRDEWKILIKEALKEWLDGVFTTFGKWSMTGILAAAMMGAIYLALVGLHLTPQVQPGNHP